MYNQYGQPQGAHQHHTHPQHHQNLQQDHVTHNATPGSINQSGFSASLGPNINFTPGNHQNAGTAATARGAQAQQQFSVHWTEQMKAYKASEQAHTTMTEQHQQHYYARTKAAENKGIGPLANASTSDAAEGEMEDRGRPVNFEKTVDRQDWQMIDMSGQGLKNVSAPLFDQYQFLTEVYLSSNQLTSLPPAVGQLRSLRLLDVSHNQLTYLPPELGMCTPLRQLLLFNNLIRDIPFELGSLHFLELLGIYGNPLDNDVKTKIMEEGTKEFLIYLKESAPVPSPPIPRQPITIQEDVSPEKERIRILSWNTLCDKYTSTTLYGYTPSSALLWDYRRDNIMKELDERDADILCLQETAIDAYDNFFNPELAKKGYRGAFIAKSRYKHMSGKDLAAVDGCSIFYKSDKYILLDKQHVDFRGIALSRADMKTDDVFNRVMPKDTVGLYCFFESRFTGNRFIVANAHLCWESYLPDVKAVQTGILMDTITKQAERYTRRPPIPIEEKQLTKSAVEDSQIETFPEPLPSQEYRSNTDIPLLVCGDYNSMAGSSVYELFDTGRISPEHPDLQGHNYGNYTRDGIEHPWSLRNSYAHLMGTPDELTFTNYTPSFSGVLDYIWYSTNSLDVVELLGPPDADYLKRVPGFPNHHFPADHIHLVGEFVFKSKKEKKALADQKS
ncbi:hypothetical protein NPX13_g2576 [Xylaria arbuscula]|uniref:CCR4-Not complex 3'-5'-exoribonuclease subunit Ccr4 n=1 Tax=Xylaria arbuscula TaxID=114810 RepID=A0A9W8NK55_9PEZI|nr:hypothetical protein NPX13_g2576 [Xylaria arbuscula]